MSKEFYQRIADIQRSLNAPKSQYNSFGKYAYRSCEDILESVKPLLNGLFLSLTDEIVLTGDRYYVRATATITDGESSHSASAMAREASDKKGMDEAQVTGAASSYARKYCLNGLFGIDDAKDSDTDEHKNQQSGGVYNHKSTHSPSGMTTQQTLERFTDKAGKMNLDELETAWQWTRSRLSNDKQSLEKATDIYEIRKSELEAA